MKSANADPCLVRIDTIADNIGMTSKKKIEDIVKGTATDKLASGVPSIVEQAAMARETATSRAVRDLIGPTSLELAMAQFESPLTKMLEASRGNLLASGVLDTDRFSAISESARGIAERMAWAGEIGMPNWPHQLAGLDTSAIGALARQQSELEKAIAGITGGLSDTIKALELAQPNLSAHVQSAIGGIASLELTNKRFAALAGITDIYGLGELHRQTAQTLLGHWHTELTLPNEYWRNFQARREFYREAEVDEGLIEADPETAIELGISSGAIVGEIIEEGRYVVGQTASGLLTLTTSNLATDIFELVGTIETALRQLISRKLHAIAGPKWFKQRVSGAVLAKAKETRERALKAGEPNAPLIEFLTLGELMEIVLRTDNWDNVFEPIFRNREWFKRDIEVIGVARNPNAHYRANDSLRLTEAMIVWQRLSSYIEDDGKWLEDADGDE